MKTLLPIAVLASGASAQTFTIRVLEPDPGTGSNGASRAYAIDEAGRVAGSRDELATRFAPDGTPLLLDPYGVGSAALAVDAGTVCGAVYSPLGVEMGLLYDDVHGLREIGEGVWDTTLFASNEHGVVVGAESAFGSAEPFVWDEASGITPLAVLPGAVASAPSDIDSDGRIVGSALVAHAGGGQSYVATVWDDPEAPAHELPELDAAGDSCAFRVLADGSVLGRSEDADGVPHGVRWTDAGLADLGLFGGQGTTARDANAAGWVVGATDDDWSFSDEEALIDLGAGWVRLADLVESNPLTLLEAVGVNGAGQIVGNGKNAGGAPRAFVLDPPARVHVEGGDLGGSLAFRHVAPRFSARLALTVGSATGTGAVHVLAPGVTLALDIDVLTLWFLKQPAKFAVVLDAEGSAATAPLPLPADPTLVGIQLHAASVVFDHELANVVAASLAAPFSLE